MRERDILTGSSVTHIMKADMKFNESKSSSTAKNPGSIVSAVSYIPTRSWVVHFQTPLSTSQTPLGFCRLLNQERHKILHTIPYLFGKTATRWVEGFVNISGRVSTSKSARLSAHIQVPDLCERAKKTAHFSSS